MFRIRFVVAAVWLAVVVLAGASAFAQPGAAVSGVIHDATGGVLPGVTVKLVGATPAASLETTSDSRGAYSFPAPTPGSYRLEVSLDGFETVTRPLVVGASLLPAVDVTLTPSRLEESVVVTARRVEEVAQEVPIPLSVVTGNSVADAGAFNVNRLKEMLPTVQFYSSNPRNSAINIRGLGAPFGLTNDGIEPGVGLYIDGVFYARPAAATLDFLDVDRIEVLRGPQGTLFGKNTTAGAINVTTKRPSFSRDGEFELNYGDLNFVQAKASISGPLSEKVAARASFSGTRRNGVVDNSLLGHDVNNLNNQGLRGQILYAPSDRLAITTSLDYTRQRPEGYTQVIAGVAPTQRAANRQWAAIISDLHYTPPSYNAFDRVTDVDTGLASNQDMGGGAVNLDWKIGRGRLNATTAYRFWNWDPSSDRDFIGLPVTTISAAPSKQGQWTQEVRYAGDISPRLNFVVGGFAFQQGIDSDPSFVQEQGSAAARFLLAPTAAAATPGLLDGYGYNQFLTYDNLSAAGFGQLEWSVNDRLRLLPGLRVNYDEKKVDFDQQVYGGLQTNDPALIALKLSVLAPQAYKTDVDDSNVSGQFTAAYKIANPVNAYATYSTSFKSVGLNLNGVPTDALGNPVLSAATVKPEDVHHFEVGVKTEPWPGVTANATVFNTDIKDFQAQVVNASVGVLRGYLANAEKVRVRGAEFDATSRVGRHLSVNGALAYTDGVYVRFTDAPPPFEETGGPQVKDISGSPLPGISKWAVSVGAEYVHPATVARQSGSLFAAVDTAYRSSFSSSASYSKYLIIDDYTLVNPRIGFRASSGWTLSLWARNVFNEQYYELMSAQPGNSGLYLGQVGDPRTFGVTLRVSVRAK